MLSRINDKVLEQFHYFNIQADIDSVYGNWAVSTDGDVVNCLYPYSILAIHFKHTDWMEKMRTKVWFKPECEDNLSKALERAKQILYSKCRETLYKKSLCMGQALIRVSHKN